MSAALDMLVVYARPLDYPDHHVVRRWRVMAGNPAPQAAGDALLFESLAAARAWITGLQLGLVCVQRDPADDPAIVEVWG